MMANSKEEKPKNKNLLELVGDTCESAVLRKQYSFSEYMDMLYENPAIARDARQRIYDMIMSYGVEPSGKVGAKDLPRYKFFDDPFDNGKNAIFGIEDVLAEFVKFLKSAASGGDFAKRFLLLRGPVASAKSSLVNLVKRGLEVYTRTDEGALYTYEWIDLPLSEREIKAGMPDHIDCPLKDDPLKLTPLEFRAPILEEINKNLPKHKQIRMDLDDQLCPLCDLYFDMLLDKYNCNWKKVLENHIRVKRIFFSELKRVGIGTFQPKDEKNQDSTELNGDLDLLKVSIYGNESDPRCFAYNGEFQKGNRGLVEFIEVLKLQIEFLYDLLSATQERKIKPKNQSMIKIDSLLLGHTNNPEFQNLVMNEKMEAFRDRIKSISVPYNLELSEEIKIYERDYGNGKTSKHIAPHTLEVASMWAILTRLADPEVMDEDMTLVQKLKLYDGKKVGRYTEADVGEFKKKGRANGEGFKGVSPRLIQNAISSALSEDYGEKGCCGGSKKDCCSDGLEGCVNAPKLLFEIEKQLEEDATISSQKEREEYKTLLELAREEYNEIAKDDLRKAICFDEVGIELLFNKYMSNVEASMSEKKVKDEITGQLVEPDEKFMKSIESRIGVGDSQRMEFRTQLLAYISQAIRNGESYDFKKNDELYRALTLEQFEQKKKTINFASFKSKAFKDDRDQKQLEIIKNRLIEHIGYCDSCADDLIRLASSLFNDDEE